MTFNNINLQGKKIFGIFESNSKKISVKNEIVSFAADYWADAIENAEDKQISYQMGNGAITLSDKEIDRFKKSFINYVSKIFPNEGSIMLWTSDGTHFEDVGTDAYLPEIMKNCNLPLICLPSDLCMWISSNKIVVENDFNQEVIYDTNKKQNKNGLL